MKHYKRYLQADNVEIPRSTLCRNRKCRLTDNISQISAENVFDSEVERGIDDANFNVTMQLPIDIVEKEKEPNDLVEEGVDSVALVSISEIFVLILSISLRHGLSDVAIEDLLKLVCLLKPDFPYSSFYLYKKQLSSIHEQVQVHLYCLDCQYYLGEVETGECPMCNTLYDKKKSMAQDSYFLYCGIENQLRNILESRNVRFMDKNRANYYKSDVIDGDAYKKLPLLPNDITLTFDIDGSPLYNSSTRSIYPILASINELILSDRKKKIICAGIWLGKDKPIATTFLKPFVAEAKSLWNIGFTWGNDQHTRCLTTIFTTDTIARPIFTNTKQFNGYYGCDFCYAKGEHHDGAHVYRHINFQHRSKDLHMIDCINAVAVGYPINGVKGTSILIDIPCFDIINNTIPDYMHSVLLGVTKHFVSLWIDNRGADYSLSVQNICDISNSWKNINLPNNCGRDTRSLTEKKKWKASEWQNFLFFGWPLVKNRIPAPYFSHWIKLVTAIMLLVSDSIHQGTVDDANTLLNEFSSDVELLYEKNHCLFNIHLLRHLALSVKNWGPLWATSCFTFENYLGAMKKMHNGTVFAAEQIAKSVLLLNNISFILKDTTRSEGFQVLFNDIFRQSLPTSESLVHLDIKPAVIDFLTMEALKTAGVSNFEEIFSCYRMHVYGQLISTHSFCSGKKRSNCYVKLSFGFVFLIKAILKISLSYFIVGYKLQSNMQINGEK